MRTFWIIAIIVILLAGVYYYIMTRVNNVSFEIKFRNLDLSMFSLQSIINGEAKVRVQLDARITNRNNFSINLSDFMIWLYYQGMIVGQTADTELNLQKVLIPANGLVNVTHDIFINLNPSTIKMLENYGKAQNIRVDYTTKFKVYFIPYSYSSFFEFKRP